MISRIYVMPKVEDSRQKLYQKSWQTLGLSRKISDLHILNSYTLTHQFSNKDLQEVAEALTNPVLEKFSINELPKDVIFRKSTRRNNELAYAIEIGFLPGVTDNVA